MSALPTGLDLPAPRIPAAEPLLELVPDPDPEGPGDPARIGAWITSAPDDDAIVCAARVAFELRAEYAELRQAARDVHGGDTKYWRSRPDRARSAAHNYLAPEQTRCVACHGRLADEAPAQRAGGAA